MSLLFNLYYYVEVFNESIYIFHPSYSAVFNLKLSYHTAQEKDLNNSFFRGHNYFFIHTISVNIEANKIVETVTVVFDF